MLHLADAAGSVSAWRFHPHPDVWLVFGALALAYLVTTSAAPAATSARLPGDPVGGAGPPPRWPWPATGMQRLSFFAGLTIMWLGADWPVHDIAESYLFSVHMVQHTLFSLIAPPLLLLGMPAPMLRWIMRPVMPVLRFLTKPLIALALFNAVVLFTHWPVIVNLAVTNELAHFGFHFLLVFASLVMWWVVVTPLRELGGMQPPGKMLFLLGQSFLPTVPASFLTFAMTPIYEVYARAPRLWGISAVTDQMIAGLIMKIGGGLILWSVIALVFFRWYAKEQKVQADEIGWEDFERELEVWDLRK